MRHIHCTQRRISMHNTLVSGCPASLLRIALVLCIFVVLKGALGQAQSPSPSDHTTEKQIEPLLETTKATQVKLTYMGPLGPGRGTEPYGTPDSLSGADLVAFKRARQIVQKVYKGRTHDLNIGWYDINNDRVPDIFIMDTASVACGTLGCSFHILVSDRNGGWKAMFGQQLLDPPAVLSSKHLGYNDLIATYEDKLDHSFATVIYRFAGLDYLPLYRLTSENYAQIDIMCTWTFPYLFDYPDYRSGMLTRLLNLR